jgi:predicted alpha/beta hydrolase family esterase
MGVRGVIPKIQLLPEHMAEPAKLVGKKIKVKVLEVDEAKNRLVVSEKAVNNKMSNKELEKEYAQIEPGKTYEASVLGTSEFGIFCDVNGIEGLVHISEISWEKVSNANLFVKPGQKIKVYVVEKNPNDMKLNLSIKRLSGDPWVGIEEKYPKDKIILVGHSLGVPAVLSYLQNTNSKQIKGCVLVSGPYRNDKKILKNFFEKEFDFATIKKVCKNFSIIHGDNDKAVPFEHATFLKENLNGNLVKVKNGGHLNGSAGFLKLPQALNEIVKITSKK